MPTTFKVGDRVRVIKTLEYDRFKITPEYIGTVTELTKGYNVELEQGIFVKFDREDESASLRAQSRGWWYSHKFELANDGYGINLIFADIDEAIEASTKIAALLQQPVPIIRR